MSARASLQAALVEAQNVRHSEVGNGRVCMGNNLKNGPMRQLQLHKSCMAKKVCKRYQTCMWLLEDSGLKMEQLGSQRKAQIHIKLEERVRQTILHLQGQLTGS